MLYPPPSQAFENVRDDQLDELSRFYQNNRFQLEIKLQCHQQDMQLLEKEKRRVGDHYQGYWDLFSLHQRSQPMYQALWAEWGLRLVDVKTSITLMTERIKDCQAGLYYLQLCLEELERRRMKSGG